MKLTKSEAGKLGAKKTNLIKQAQVLQKQKSYNLNPSLCKNCGKPIPYFNRKGTYCSRYCSAHVNGLNKRKNGNEPSNCLNCGQKTRSSTLLHCSRFCQLEKLYKHKEQELRNGKPASLHVIKKVLLRINRCCAICLNTEWNNQPVPLQLDHIDGNPENGKFTNLRLICPNCHAQTPTYCGKNRGNGRYLRRVLYSKRKNIMNSPPS